MPPRISFTNFNRRLNVAGGREQVPEGSLRRARGVAPELTGSVQSMFPPLVLYGIKSLNLIRFNDKRYQFDGKILYKFGTPLTSGFNGNRATFVTMPPASGLQDYLFMAGAGKLIKIAPDDTVTNWGIERPPDQLAVTKVAQDIITIDNFDSHAGNWTTHLCAVANDNTEFQFGTGSLKVTPSALAPLWFINSTVGYPKDLSKYPNGDISLPTDLISLWVSCDVPAKTVWFWIMFDVSDGTFKTDYYLAVIQIVTSTNNTHAAGANALIPVDKDRWTQLTLAKSQFQRIGTKLNLDWSNVVAVRIEAGGPGAVPPNPVVNLDQFQMIGGQPLGVGPAAISGGSEYEYFSTFLNLVTGNRSNPQPDSAKVFGVALQANSLTQIPTSTDSQVGARELWRTSAENFGGSQTAFILDTIYDNTTTVYTDVTADTSIPITQTPWIKSSAYILNQLVDAGNGYYFKVTVAGTTGAVSPTWQIPQSTWVALGAFLLNTTIAPRKAAGRFFKATTAGTTGRVEPNWAAVAGGGTVTDGTVVWTDQGTLSTVDNTVTWLFQGINSTPVLGNQAIQFDNIKPFATIGDAVGPWQGSMVWTRDSAAGSRGNIYFSPPGRAEGMGLFINVSTDTDPTQKAIIWQEQLFLVTVNAIYRLDGTYPNIAPTKLYDHSGSTFPFTMVADKRGIYYRDQDALHGMNYGGNPMVGFEQLATILRHQPAENLPAFLPTFAGFAREEIYWSDETQVTLAMNLNPETGHAWRSFNVAMTAIYYEEETGEIIASWNGVTGLWEHPDFTIIPGDNLRVSQVSVEIAMPNLP